MTKDEYLERAGADAAWAPGWLAVDGAFDRLYPGVTPRHLGTELAVRASLGGSEYLDGFSLYPSPNGYQHLVTYGMSSLYVDEESYGGQFSGWGYEMTMKMRASQPEECNWAVNSLRALGRYTYTSNRWFEPYQVINGRGQPLRSGSDTLLTSYLVVPDTEVPGIDTLHGRLDFLQFVGITQPEHDWVAHDLKVRAIELAQRIAEDSNPHLATDLTRQRSYA